MTDCYLRIGLTISLTHPPVQQVNPSRPEFSDVRPAGGPGIGQRGPVTENGNRPRSGSARVVPVPQLLDRAASHDTGR